MDQIKGFMYLLCNRILAILVRNPIGMDKTTVVSDYAWLGSNSTPGVYKVMKPSQKFLERFGNIRFKHFHSPVVDLGNLKKIFDNTFDETIRTTITDNYMRQ